jgi:long-chain fatty acid transport protein
VKKLFTLVVILGLLTNITYGSGFQLNEHGARAMAMAGAFTGLANDPSAIYFNPAGITQLNGTQFYAGATLIMPLSSYTSPKPSLSTTDMVGQIFTPINFYITHQFSNKLYVGLSINNQYGLGTKWDPNWAGRYLAVETAVTTFYFTPVIAYKLLDNLSISAGPAIAIASIKLSNRVKNPSPVSPVDPLVTLQGDNVTGIGFTVGILYKPSDKLQIGASYRSQTKFDLTGTASSSPATFVMPVLVAAPSTYVNVTVPWPNGVITSQLTTPANATLGLAFMPNTDWTMTFDFQYVGWSSYDQLQVTFATYDLDPLTAGNQNVETVPRNYQDSYIVRLGFEYKTSADFAVRFGVLYDKNPVKDAYVEPTLPDADRIGLNIGFGGKLTNHLGIDFAYMFLSFADRTVGNSAFGFNGTYANSAHLIGCNFSYSL